MKASSPQNHDELLNKSLQAFKFGKQLLLHFVVFKGDKEKGDKKKKI